MHLGRILLSLSLASSAGPVFAQGIAVQWNFNNSDTVASINNSGGTPTVTGLGGIITSFAGEGGGDGSSDPSATNMGFQTTGYPARGTSNLTAGVGFTMPTTGYSDLIARLDLRHSNTASEFFRIEYTTDGTNWTSTGTTAAQGFDRFFTYTVDLTGISAANNNPNFGIRVLTEFAPGGGSTYAPANPSSTYAGTGTMRFDMVTVSRTNRWLGGTSSDVGVAANWQGNSIPSTSDATVVFGNSAGAAVNLPIALGLGQLVFATDASAHTFTSTGGAALSLANGILHKGSTSQTFNLTFSLGAGSPTFANAGTLVFNQPITVATDSLAIGLAMIGWRRWNRPPLAMA